MDFEEGDEVQFISQGYANSQLPHYEDVERVYIIDRVDSVSSVAILINLWGQQKQRWWVNGNYLKKVKKDYEAINYITLEE